MTGGRAAADHEAQMPVRDFFRSVDSAPRGYSVSRPASGTNGFLVTFVGISILMMCARLLAHYTGFAQVPTDLVVFADGRGDVAFPLRLFLVIFFFTYAVYAYTNLWRRAFLAFSLLGKFAAFCIVVDTAGWLLHEAGILTISVFGGQMISGLAALAIFPHTVLRQAHLPETIEPPTGSRISLGSFAVLACCLLLSAVGAVLALRVFTAAVDQLKDWAILGGIGAGVFLMQQLLAASTALVGFRRLRRTRDVELSPPVGVLVPAHNEAHSIGATIAAVDAAAASYPGDIGLYVVDNASTDGTRAVAESAMASCAHVTGQVLDCPEPGKAIALNLGIERITEEFVVRIDADTVIGDDCLRKAMRHFAAADVGCVGGIPMPLEERTWIDKCRLIEVYMRHGFYQISLDAYAGVMGIPGMFAVYRRDQLRAVGGIVEGMNGEDTDICMRLAAAGYRNVADPHAVYYSETPAGFAHLREQRTRWFRSIYHLAGRNRAMIFDGRTMVGTFVLPFNLVNAARRAMLAPLLLFTLLAVLVFQSAYPTLRWQPIAATLLGMSMLLTVTVCLCWRRSSVRYIPLFIAFRVLRSYFTLAAALSLRYPPMRPRRPRWARKTITTSRDAGLGRRLRAGRWRRASGRSTADGS
ncbi:glycosyltransferase family 2 protein [Gordonia alkaliphila]|uniref:Glycosyltransferase n=1 Tax=Gordonia alkaliphila TaxID=1053547 RepID=A0ABP8Z0U2_9ACTN